MEGAFAVAYDVVYTSTDEGRELSVEQTRESYVRLGAWWVPAARSVARLVGGAAAGGRQVTLGNVTLGPERPQLARQ